MCRRRSVLALAIATLLLLLPLFACTPSGQTQQQQPPSAAKQAFPGDTIMRVNGSAITRAELDRALKMLLERSQLRQPVATTDIQQLKKEAVEQVVSSELLYQAAGKAGVGDLERQVAQAITRERSRYHSDHAFVSDMKSAGLTQPQLEQSIRKKVAIAGFLEKKFGSRIEVGADEARTFYEQNRDRFKKGSTVRASQIFVVVSDPCQERDKERARARAEILLHRVREGENFSILAQSHSDCPSKARGGDLGIHQRGELDPRLEQTVFELKPGEISDLVQTPLGFHILKLTEKHGPRLESYQEAKAEIYASLRRAKMQPMVTKYVTELLGKAKVDRLASY